MKSFSTFITEDFEHDGEPLDMRYSAHKIKRNSSFGSQKVSVGFQHNPNRPGEYDVGFYVNGYASKGMNHPDRDTADRITNHVRSTVSDFIKTYRPKAIHMLASDMNYELQNKKKDAYRLAARVLAKKYGGEHRDDGADQNSVFFNDYHERYK